MKKFLAVLILVVLSFSCFISVCADEEDDSNIIDSANSGFENVTNIEDTKWFRLIDSFGDSKQKDLTDITIKTDGGNTGSNYLSMTANKSWFSPSINLYPFFKEAGPGEYMLTYYIRCEKKVPESFMVRGLKSDLEVKEDDEDTGYFPDLQDRGNSNYYRSHSGTLTDNGGWFFFESDIFEVTEESLSQDHNWWFVLGSMVNSTFTVDIDDFRIISADDYVSPYAIKDTEISYLSSDVIENAFKVTVPQKTDAPSATNAPTQTDAPTPTVTEKTDITLYVCLGIGALAVLVAVPILIIKKKKK